MPQVSVGKATAIAVPTIAAVVAVLFGVSYLISSALGLPSSLNLPAVVRVLGAGVVLVGVSLGGWVFVHRSPINMIVSTYITFTKLFRRVPVSERAGRTEPLVVSGPQRYTRNPLYFGVVVMVLGWALVSASCFVLVATLVILLWFSLFLIPFEERELRALFGEQWLRYSRETPMLIPFTKRKPRSDDGTQPRASARVSRE
jgi:protein-S-isoprenylcysteine O-methyltransferase Ste14